MEINGKVDGQEDAGMTRSPFFQLLDQMGNTNPKLRMIAEIMDQYGNRQKKVEEKSRSDLQQLLLKLKQLGKENAEWRRKNEELKKQLGIQLQRNQSLALAIGACPRCWGENPECKFCQGRGMPGEFMPHQEAFNELCLPAVQTLHERIYSGKTKVRPTDKDES